MTGSDGPVRRVVVAPDKLKGSLGAMEAAAALAAGIRAVRPRLPVLEHPIADGGEGTVGVLLRAGFEEASARVAGPLGEPVQGRYAVCGGLAVIELADVAGLARLPQPGPTRHTACTASTRGVGELIAHAVSGGATRIVLGLGGSASTDGGAGALTALGARVLDATGAPVPDGGAGLLAARRLDLTGLDPRLPGVQVTVAGDVDSPLLGPHGAAAVFAPQKGAGRQEVPLLERALTRWAELVAETTGADLRDLPGAGAAGGMGFGAAAVLGARIRPGIDLLLELTGLGRELTPGTLVVVAEGSLDAQSLRGKGPVGVARAARAAGATTVAVAGRVTISAQEARDAGLAAVYALSDLEPDPARSMTRAGALLERVGAQLARDWVVERADHGLSPGHA